MRGFFGLKRFRNTRKKVREMRIGEALRPVRDSLRGKYGCWSEGFREVLEDIK